MFQAFSSFFSSITRVFTTLDKVTAIFEDEVDGIAKQLEVTRDQRYSALLTDD